MRRGRAFGAACLFCAIVAGCAPSPPPLSPPPEPWPTNGWAVSTPEAQGIDSDVLADAVETIRAKHVPIHSLFVERNGYAVLDAYFFPFQDNETHDLASVTKSITSTLVGIAEREHRIGSLNRPISALLPDETRSLDDPRKGGITLANLLSMTSGLDCSAAPGENLLLEMEQSPDWLAFMLKRPLAFEPGTTFRYCGGSFHLVSAVIGRATGESAFALARSAVFAPLGIDHAIWPADPQGNSLGFADLELQPRDAAKLGYLWLHGGRWDDRQIIPKTWFAEALAPHAAVQPGVAYGYGFWLYPGHRPFDFEANGRGGQRILVMPDENLVAVITSGGADADFLTPFLTAAVKANAPLAPNPGGDLRLAAAVAGAKRAPAPGMPTPVPQWAESLSGRTYLVGDNPLGLLSLQLSFTTPGEAVLRLGFADGAIVDHPVGLDGVPRVSLDPTSGHHIALLGQWRDGEFDLDYNEIARIDDYRLRLAPDSGGLAIHLTERTGLVDMVLEARAAAPQGPENSPFPTPFLNGVLPKARKIG